VIVSARAAHASGGLSGTAVWTLVAIRLPDPGLPSRDTTRAGDPRSIVQSDDETGSPPD